MCGLLATALGLYAVCVARAQPGSEQPQPGSQPAPQPAPQPASLSSPTNDLDAFMASVLERRSQNWRTLRDYVLNEKEHFELLGPGCALLFGTQREFIWYLRDGVLVRSPVRFDGVKIGDDERKRYEENWTRREHQREERRARRLGHDNAAAPVDARIDGEAADDEESGGRAPRQATDVAARAHEGIE